jgi:TPP-dependent pyruvate/acetoin dehydrogenase alpha subunit
MVVDLHTPTRTASSSGAAGPQKRDLVRAIAPDGSVSDAYSATLESAAELYRHMVMLRLVGVRIAQLCESEDTVTPPFVLGHEAVVVGATLAARPQDWVFPGQQDWGTALVRGFATRAFFEAALAHTLPPPARSLRIGPTSGVPGAHLVQAVGAAWAAKMLRDDVGFVVLAGNEVNGGGDVHNALNFAAVFKANCVFVCREQPSTPDDGARTSVEGRAEAYGLASARVDGSDALAVLAVVRASLARLAAGLGPTLLHVVTPSFASATAAKGIEENAIFSLAPDDPLAVLRRALEAARLFDAAENDAFVRSTRASIEQAVAEAQTTSQAEISTIFNHVYAEVPWHLEAQKAQKESAT